MPQPQTADFRGTYCSQQAGVSQCGDCLFGEYAFPVDLFRLVGDNRDADLYKDYRYFLGYRHLSSVIAGLHRHTRGNS